MTYGMIYLIIFIIALVITLIISWYCSNKFFNQYVYVNFFTRKGYKIISVSGEEYVSCDNPISSYTNNLILAKNSNGDMVGLNLKDIYKICINENNFIIFTKSKYVVKINKQLRKVNLYSKIDKETELLKILGSCDFSDTSSIIGSKKSQNIFKFNSDEYIGTFYSLVANGHIIYNDEKAKKDIISFEKLDNIIKFEDESVLLYLEGLFILILDNNIVSVY